MIFIGNIIDRKNAFIIPDILQKLIKYNSSIKLLIITHFGEIDKLRNTLFEKKLNNNVEFVFYISEELKKEYLARSKMMIFPSKYEGFGTVVAEGLASCLPVVIFDVPTLRTFNKGVLKARPFDINEFVEKIIYLLKNEEIRKSMGLEGKHDMEERFDYTIVSEIENRAINESIKYSDVLQQNLEHFSSILI